MLSTGLPGTLEIQIGARAFVRAWANTQLSLANQDPDFIQFTLVAGSAVFDLRALEPGDTVEVDTPNAAVTIQQAGYYRLETTGERSRVMTREGGRATVTPASGQAVTITPSEELVIEGTAVPAGGVRGPAARRLGPLELRADRPASRRGERALCFCRHVRASTWTHTAPGGWSRPTGRSGCRRACRPAGPRTARDRGYSTPSTAGPGWTRRRGAGLVPPRTLVLRGRLLGMGARSCDRPPRVCSRAVAFFGDPGGVVIGPAPAVSWVALGWGEPVVPWWGRRGGVRGPSWRGWAGPAS